DKCYNTGSGFWPRNNDFCKEAMLMRPTNLLRWLPLLLALVMVFGDATALAQDNGRTPLTIGFSQVGSESDWRTAFTEITLAEAERRGINLIFSNAENSQERSEERRVGKER